MKSLIKLSDLKKNENLRLKIKEALEREYLNSFMTIPQFEEKFSINYKSISYVMKVFNLKKDKSIYNPSKNPDVVAKIKQTKFERYGDENYNNSKKNEETCLKKYGVAHVKQLEEIKKKGQNTFNRNYPKDSEAYKKLNETISSKRKETLKKINYGEKVRKRRAEHLEEDPNFLINIQEKRKVTTREKYGVDNISQLEEIKQKKKDSYFEHYGITYGKASEVLEKIRMTCSEKYGVDWYSKTLDYNKKRAKKWIVDGKKFDSKWEIYYYYYLIDNNIPFKEQVPLNYEDSEGNTHTYFCDFQRLDTNELIEIKNPALLDEEGNLKALFTSKLSSEELLKLEEQLKEKTKCMKINNVKVLSDISFFKKLEKLFYINHLDLSIDKGD